MPDPNIILPSIGSVVWFRPAAQANPNGQPHAALIAFVQSERLVNLAAFDENGTGYSATSVPLLQGDEAPPTDGTAYAEWMPFQKGQVAKLAQREDTSTGIGTPAPVPFPPNSHTMMLPTGAPPSFAHTFTAGMPASVTQSAPVPQEQTEQTS